MTNTNKPHRSIVVKSVIVVFAMLAFVFIGLVPMYNLICSWTGVTGRTGGPYDISATQTTDTNRTVQVQFLANNNDGMTWQFYPEIRSIDVHPGELQTVIFKAVNSTDKTMSAQAVPSVSPFQATNYFHKTECFCFEQQQLTAGESVDMGLRFMVDPDLPKDIDTLTLSYTLFNVTQVAATGEYYGQ